MKNKTTSTDQPVSAYDDGNIPAIDLPHGEDAVKQIDPLPEYNIPRKDAPGRGSGE